MNNDSYYRAFLSLTNIHLRANINLRRKLKWPSSSNKQFENSVEPPITTDYRQVLSDIRLTQNTPLDIRRTLLISLTRP